MDSSLPGSFVHGILQQEYWSGLLCSRETSNLGIKPVSLAFPALAGGFFFFFFLPLVPPGKPINITGIPNT